jgi:hypothetical protein
MKKWLIDQMNRRGQYDFEKYHYESEFNGKFHDEGQLIYFTSTDTLASFTSTKTLFQSIVLFNSSAY